MRWVVGEDAVLDRMGTGVHAIPDPLWVVNPVVVGLAAAGNVQGQCGLWR